MYITFMPFYPKKKRSETFKTGKLDIAVFFLILVVFLISFFVLSFKPLLNENGTEVYSERYWRETGDGRITVINDFALIGGLIMTYEIFLFTLDGKKRGRALPWGLYYARIIYAIQMKIKEGKELNKEYFDKRRKR